MSNSRIVSRVAAAAGKGVRQKSSAAKGGEIAPRRAGGRGEVWSPSMLPPSASSLFEMGPASSALAPLASIFDAMARPLLTGGLLSSPPAQAFFQQPSLIPDVRSMLRDMDRTLSRTVGLHPIAIDLVEDEKSYTVLAELPGVAKKDIHVDVDEDAYLLTITAEKSRSHAVGPRRGAGAGAAGAAKKGGAAAAAGKKKEQGMEAAGAAGTAGTEAGAAEGEAKKEGEGKKEAAATPPPTTTTTSSSEVSEPSWHHTERAWGRVSRSIPIPADVDLSGITSNLHEGTLHVVMPKKAEAGQGREGRRTINVE